MRRVSELEAGGLGQKQRERFTCSQWVFCETPLLFLSLGALLFMSFDTLFGYSCY